jgi:hypothetical protein
MRNGSAEAPRMEEIDCYIRFRLNISGYRGLQLFSRPAVQLIATVSDGSLRQINLLAHKAMMAAYSRGLRYVEPHHIQLACQEQEKIQQVVAYDGVEAILDGDILDQDDSMVVLDRKPLYQDLGITDQSQRWWRVAAIITAVTTGTLSWNIAQGNMESHTPHSQWQSTVVAASSEVAAIRTEKWTTANNLAPSIGTPVQKKPYVHLVTMIDINPNGGGR